jgi:hypothetical protein
MTKAMTSRERLLGALRHEPIDRVPICTYEMVPYDYDGYWNKEPSYTRLMNLAREKTDCLFVYGIPSLYRMHPNVKVDVSSLETPDGLAVRTTVHTPLGPLATASLRKPGIFTTWHTKHLLKNEDDIQRYKSIEWVRSDRTPDYGAFHAMDKRLGDRGLPAPDTGDAFCAVAGLFSFEDYTLMAFTQTELMRELVVAEHVRVMAKLRAALEAGFHGLFRIYGSEYGAEPYVPPRIWDTLEKPFLKEMCDLIHSYPNCFARVHSHARLRGILPMLMQCGIRALDPCEPPPDGDMTLAELKAQIGDRVCLMGSMELKMLETGTPEQVREEVRKSMDMAKEGSGYIAITTASPINTPLDPKTEANYFAWIEANRELGVYR